MLIGLILALLAGSLLGMITGLIPGIHINLVSTGILALSSSFVFQRISPSALVVFFVALSITHTFSDFIPSIFLGAPDNEDNALSILPGHQMLMGGEAHEAIVFTLYGSLASIFIIFLFSPIFIIFLPRIYPHAQAIMPFILMLTCFFLIYFEKSSRFLALIIFLLAGLLGIASFNLPLKEPLLPLFTGLFGISSLITSVKRRQKLPNQKIRPLREIKIKKSGFCKALFASAIASPLCSFLPGLGSGQAAVIGSEVVGDLDKKEFLILLGAINTIVTGLSFIALYSIQKARTGVAVVVAKLVDLNQINLFVVFITIFLSGLFSFFMTLLSSKIISKRINKINYSIISYATLFFVIVLNLIFSGFLGLAILSVSSILGLACIYSGVRRTHLMGCLLIPTILLYLS